MSGGNTQEVTLGEVHRSLEDHKRDDEKKFEAATKWMEKLDSRLWALVIAAAVGAVSGVGELALKIMDRAHG